MPRPRKTTPWNRRPINRTPANADPEKVKAILALFKANIETNTGTDDNPSDFWKALAAIEGVDADGLELVQDIMLFSAEILGLAIDNYGDGNAFGQSLALLAMGAVPEFKADVDAINE
jgi:hypothetical protein